MSAPSLQPLAPTSSHAELLDGLNDPQRAAVVHAGAPLLVVAGGGAEGAMANGTLILVPDMERTS